MKDLIVIKQSPIIPQDWDYDRSVTKCRNLFKEVRENGAIALTELFVAHIILTEDSKKKIDRKYPGKTFGAYCSEIGVDEKTGYNWLHKYFGLPGSPILEISSIPLPEGTYQVIVIDPPWPYGGSYDPDTHRVASPYPEMSLEELAALDIPSANDCILWLWVTNGFMHEAYHILEAWTFEPKTILTWFKERTGVGYWLRGETEHCLLAIKGHPPISHEVAITTHLKVKSVSHSSKPDEFYEIVGKLCGQATELTHLEMFARKRRKEWSTWGNQIKS